MHSVVRRLKALDAAMREKRCTLRRLKPLYKSSIEVWSALVTITLQPRCTNAVATFASLTWSSQENILALYFKNPLLPCATMCNGVGGVEVNEVSCCGTLHGVLEVIAGEPSTGQSSTCNSNPFTVCWH